MQRVRDEVLLQRLLRLRRQVALRLQYDILPRLLPLDHPRMHLLSRRHRVPPLIQLLLTRLTLLANKALQLDELRPRHILCMRRVMGHQ